MRRPRPRSYHRQRRRSEHRNAWIIIALAGLVLAGVVAGAIIFRPEKLGRNGCPLDRHAAPAAKTVILIDQTDALPASELVYLSNLVQNEYAWLPDQGVLAIRLISAEAPDGLTPVTACRMSDGSTSRGIVDNPVALRKDYERKVGAPLKAFLASLASQPEQPKSPILETIVATMRDPSFAPDIATRRLVIVSDMAQNSDVYSQYGRLKHFSLAPQQAEAFDAQFGGTQVRIQYIHRPKLRMQGAAHQAFWRGYFTARGAQDVAIGHQLNLGEPDDRKVWYGVEDTATVTTR